MDEEKNRKSKKRLKIVCLLVLIVILAMILEAGILINVNTRNANKTSLVLLNQAINIIEKNQKNEADMIESLKEDFIIRAKAVSYILDAKPEAEYDEEELQKIADLMGIDEIHLFNETGTIYSGTVPKYYGYSFDSGEQMAYFKPMLENKMLTMCQDVTPNTSEGKKMMYAITWNEAGDRMIQVGIKPVRLLAEVKQNEVSSVVSNMPVYEGICIYVADLETGLIKGATDSSQNGKTLDEAGIPLKKLTDGETVRNSIWIDGEQYSCIFKKTGNYVVGVTFAIASDNEKNLTVMLIMAIYLCVAAGVILFMVFRVLKANQRVESERRKKEKLLQVSNTDQLTGCFNRRAYENDISTLSQEKEFICISMDVNGLKIVNDSLGHGAGDELLKGAALCMKESFDSCGKVYRVGGDEFIILVFTDDRQFEKMLKEFEERVKKWSGRLVKSMTVSCGCVSSRELPWEEIEELVRLADMRMYEKKVMYYRKNGVDRNGQPFPPSEEK